MSQNMAKITAQILIETKAVLFRPNDPFTLTSGRKSPVYVDCRRLIAFPRARRRLMQMAIALIEEKVGFEKIDLVAGGETAGIAFAAWIAEKLMLPMAYIRKKPKGFGRNARIEGHLQSGDQVLLVEDLATDGGSKQSFVQAITEAGGHCTDCFVIFQYGNFPETEKYLQQHGLTIHALAKWQDVLKYAGATNYLDTSSLRVIEAFLDNPQAWSENYSDMPKL